MAPHNPGGNPESFENMQGILPFLPMLYVGWADAVLTPTQIDTIRAKINEQGWLKEPEKALLSQWLDPKSPPSVTEMKRWLNAIRQVADLIPDESRQTLADIGLQIAQIGPNDDNKRCSTPAACQALSEVEAALGVVGHEAYRALVSDSKPVAPIVEASEPITFNVSAMAQLLDGDQADIRHKIRLILSDPTFRLVEPGLPTAAYRTQILDWCQKLADQGLGLLGIPSAYGGSGTMAHYLAAMETLSFHDLSLVIKFGVQFGLFGGSVYQLGTEQHHQKYLPDIGSLALPGCFAMTELGHGSNVRDIQTTARYEVETETFIINTPTEQAQKMYIGNAANHGQMATVFAQLEIDGENYGVNAFLVPIRNANGQTVPNIRIADNGEKMGLNGVDNGRIWFDNVHIPRENLLNRFSQVSAKGLYTSPIANESRRFFTMLGTLVGGRVGIGLAALSAAKTGLTIAIKYAAQRRQFGPPGQPETLLLDYRTHQRRLMPLLANAYALDFALKYVTQRFINRSEEDSREVEALAAGLKAFSSWNTTHTIQSCREACGGQGYLAENRFAALKADTDIFTTFEGDNTVLMQLVAKGLLSDFKQQFHDINLFGLVRYITHQATQVIAEMNPIITRTTDEAHLLDTTFHLNAFRYRETDLVISAAKRLKKRIDRGEDSYQAFIECQDHLVNLAQAHIERVILEQFIEGVSQCESPDLARTLKSLCDLFALWHIEKHKGWYLEHGYLEGAKTKAIRRQIDQLCLEIRQQAIPLVTAFNIPDSCIAAPIALSPSTTEKLITQNFTNKFDEP